MSQTVRNAQALLRSFEHRQQREQPDWSSHARDHPKIAFAVAVLDMLNGPTTTDYKSNREGCWEPGKQLNVHCSGFAALMADPYAVDAIAKSQKPRWLTDEVEYKNIPCAYQWAAAGRDGGAHIHPYYDQVFDLAKLQPGDVVARGNLEKCGITGHVWIVLTAPDEHGRYWAIHSADKPKRGIQLTVFTIGGPFGANPSSDTFVGALRPLATAIPSGHRQREVLTTSIPLTLTKTRLDRATIDGDDTCVRSDTFTEKACTNATKKRTTWRLKAQACADRRQHSLAA